MCIQWLNMEFINIRQSRTISYHENHDIISDSRSSIIWDNFERVSKIYWRCRDVVDAMKIVLTVQMFDQHMYAIENIGYVKKKDLFSGQSCSVILVVGPQSGTGKEGSPHLSPSARERNKIDSCGRWCKKRELIWLPCSETGPFRAVFAST